MRLHHIALLGVLASSCVTYVAEQCPRCAVVDAARPSLPPLKPGARTLFVLVPGILGFGWEWDGAIAELRQARDADFVVFWWAPHESLARAAAELASVLEGAFVQAPPSVREVVVMAHSVGGLVALQAIAGLSPPAGRHLRIVTVAAPLAGVMAWPMTLDDPLRTPAWMAMLGTFRTYPPVPPGVDVVEYVTSPGNDAAMQRRLGHDPADPAVGPRGATRVVLSSRVDHNDCLSPLLRAELVAARARLSPSPPTAP